MGIETDNLKSPINGSPLIPKGDGTYYSEYDGLTYIINEKGNVVVMQSPINGSPLTPKGDGTYYSESDDLIYIVNEKGNVVVMQSSINGSPLIPRGDGTYYSEYDGLTYIINEDGTIIKQEKDYKISLEDIEASTENVRLPEVQQEDKDTNQIAMEGEREEQTEK